MLHELKIKSHEDTMFTEVYVDGEKVNRITGVEFEQFANEMPTAILHLAAVPDIKTFANVLYVADEEGVYRAIKYLRESVEKDEALRDEFKSRILSALDEVGVETTPDDLAREILDVIFGEESK